jgi:hypothetical protein
MPTGCTRKKIMRPACAPAKPKAGYFKLNIRGRYGRAAAIAIAALGYLAEDGAVSSRELFGHQTQPGGEVATFRERLASINEGSITGN